MAKIKVYLAGPMRGIPEFNFPAFAFWASELRNKGYEVFSPAEKGAEKDVEANPELQHSLEFRRKVFLMDTEYICKHADAIALMPGWNTSSGARAEYALAKAIGIPFMLLGDAHVAD